jgi:hypothetical protein
LGSLPSARHMPSLRPRQFRFVTHSISVAFDVFSLTWGIVALIYDWKPHAGRSAHITLEHAFELTESRPLSPYKSALPTQLLFHCTYSKCQISSMPIEGLLLPLALFGGVGGYGWRYGGEGSKPRFASSKCKKSVNPASHTQNHKISSLLHLYLHNYSLYRFLIDARYVYI